MSQAANPNITVPSTVSAGKSGLVNAGGNRRALLASICGAAAAASICAAPALAAAGTDPIFAAIKRWTEAYRTMGTAWLALDELEHKFPDLEAGPRVMLYRLQEINGSVVESTDTTFIYRQDFGARTGSPVYASDDAEIEKQGGRFSEAERAAWRAELKAATAKHDAACDRCGLTAARDKYEAADTIVDEAATALLACQATTVSGVAALCEWAKNSDDYDTAHIALPSIIAALRTIATA